MTGENLSVDEADSPPIVLIKNKLAKGKRLEFLNRSERTDSDCVDVVRSFVRLNLRGGRH